MEENPNDINLINIFGIFIVCLQQEGSLFSQGFTNLFYRKGWGNKKKLPQEKKKTVNLINCL
jgi:hypothetical protein